MGRMFLTMSDHDFCGNCHVPFQKKCSKVKNIAVNKPLGSGNSCEEEIISIDEALAVIFEIPPLSLTKKQYFAEENSAFSRGTNSKRCFAICAKCSEALKALYNSFQDFTSTCKLNSEIGKILSSLINSKSDNGKEDVPVDDIEKPSSTVRIRVKVERESGDEEEENEEFITDSVRDGGSVGVDESGVKLPPPDSDDENCHVSNSSLGERLSDEEESTRIKQGRQIPRRSCTLGANYVERDDETKDQHAAKNHNIPQKVSIRIAGSQSYITQLVCPKCDKRFLHESTLICHRRIIHGENIRLSRPPAPLQAKLTQQSNLERVKALAEVNGKTSMCPICRMEVPRMEIRHHLATHTRSLSKPWLCTTCGRNFNDHDSLYKHATSHISGFPCKRCGKRVPILEMLNHIRNCSGTGTGPSTATHTFSRQASRAKDHRSKVNDHCWRCKLCGIKFTQRDKMQKHMDTHRQTKSYKCKICDKSFNRIDVLRLHIKRFHRNNEGPPSVQRSVALESGDGQDDDFANDDFDFENDFPITPAPVSTSVPEEKGPPTVALNDNVDLIAPIQENRFVCRGCCDTFSRAAQLDKHLVEAHAEEKSFLCKICNRRLQDVYCLKLHVKTHGEMKPLDCFFPGCEKVYRDKNTFFYHLKEKHGLDTKSIVMKYPDVFRQPDKDYTTRAVRSRIGQATSAPKQGKFPCETCGRIFPTVYRVRAHVKLVHDKVRDFLCKYCGKAFARKSYFLIHERLHTSNESPYKCHLCGKGFRLPGNLRMHLKSTIHNPNRDYVCDICGKGFNRNDNLRLHVKTVHLKMPSTRKPKSEVTDRYSHGGRNRIYIAGTDANESSNLNSGHTVISCSLASQPVAGTSNSFFISQQNSNQQAFGNNLDPGTLIQKHKETFNPTSKDNHLSGSAAECGKSSPSSIVEEHSSAAYLSQVPLPLLHLHSQDGRGATGDGGQQQHPYSQGEYNMRGFQYRMQ